MSTYNQKLIPVDSSNCNPAYWSTPTPQTVADMGFPSWSRASPIYPCSLAQKNDLLMRRKAQVLQHQNNSSKLTKKQQLSKILRTSLPLSKKTANCPTSTIYRYPSSASDVPGNSILKLDLNFPPWGANYQKRSFAMGNSNTTRPSLFGP